VIGRAVAALKEKHCKGGDRWRAADRGQHGKAATWRTKLRKTQMMRIRRMPTTNQAGLFADMPDMVVVTHAARFGEYKDALVGLWCLQALISE
jgi:hypothetical protein